MTQQVTLTPEQIAMFERETLALFEYVRSRNLDWGEACGICALAIGKTLEAELPIHERSAALQTFMETMRHAAGLGKPSAH